MSRKARDPRYVMRSSQAVSGYDHLEVVVVLSRFRPVFLGPQSALISS